MASDQEAVNVTEKRLIVEALELYKDFPCLWDSSHNLYCNKDARNQAWEIILEKWKTGYPRATIEDVKKKLEHLRAAYRRERKKVESSKSTGAGSEDVHTPTLWYYPYFSFLHEKTMPTSLGIDNITGTSDSNSEEPATKKEKTSNKRQNALYKKQEELIQSATQLIKESSSHEDTSADAFGRSVSSQLKELPKLQRCIVEKLIGELLFYAKLGELSVDASINLNKNIHNATQSYYTQPYRSHLYQQHSLPSSPCPQYLQPSPSPNYSQPSPSPNYSQPSPSPKYSQPSPSSQHSQPSPSPKYSQPSLSPQHSQPSPSPKYSHPSPSPKYSQPSPSSQHSQPSPSPKYSQPSLSPQHSQPSPSPKYSHPSPSPQHSQPSPSPKYSQPSPSPQHTQPSPSPKYSQPSPSPQHSQPLSSPHYLQHSSSSSLRQHSTPSLPQTPADSITIYSADPHSQYLSLSQVLLPNDFSETIITNDTVSELIPSGETQCNVQNASASGSSISEMTQSEMTQTVFRGRGQKLQKFLILSKK